MGNFVGGSASAMVRQVADGLTPVTERSFLRLSPGELEALGGELEKLLREVRGEAPAAEDLSAVQRRNRRIERLNTCRAMLRTFRQRRPS